MRPCYDNNDPDLLQSTRDTFTAPEKSSHQWLQLNTSRLEQSISSDHDSRDENADAVRLKRRFPDKHNEARKRAKADVGGQDVSGERESTNERPTFIERARYMTKLDMIQATARVLNASSWHPGWNQNLVSKFAAQFEELGRIHFFTKLNITADDRRAIFVRVLGGLPSGTSSKSETDREAYTDVRRNFMASSLYWKNNWQAQMMKAFVAHVEACARSSVDIYNMDADSLTNYSCKQYLQADLGRLFPHVKKVIDFEMIKNPPQPIDKIHALMAQFCVTLYANFFRWVCFEIIPIKQALRHDGDSKRLRDLLRDKKSEIYSRAPLLGNEPAFQILNSRECWPVPKIPERVVPNVIVQEVRSIREIDPAFRTFPGLPDIEGVSQDMV